MYGRLGFEDCIKANLKGKGFGEKKTAEILGVYNRKVAIKTQGGLGEVEAAFHSMHETLDEIVWKARKKLQQANKNIAVAAVLDERIKQGYRADLKTSALVGDRGAGWSGGLGSKFARAAMSVLIADPRFSGRNVEAVYKANRDRYIALLGDSIMDVKKGAFGSQTGKAHLPNIVRELFGTKTGDAEAAKFAKAYQKLQDEMIDHFNRVGGALRKRLDFNMPQWQNSAKLNKAGMAKWVSDHMKWVDWNKMLDDEGNIIPVDKRESVLRDTYQVIQTDGAIAIKPDMFAGRGHSVANLLDKHRFLVYKDAASWMEMHSAYGDGNAIDVIMEHINDMARKTALVDMLGTNPAMWIDQAKGRVRLEAGNVQGTAASIGVTKKDKRAVVESDEAMRRAEQVHEVLLHRNAINPDSGLANVAMTSSNILTSAQLTGAILPAMPGDTLNMAFVRFANRMPVTGHMSTILKDMGSMKELETFMANAGFVLDETITSVYAAERFTGIATYGSPISRKIADSALRASGLNRWTNAARSTAKKELMSILARYADKPLNELPFERALWRAGITARDWDAVRKAIPLWQPVQGAKFFRPVDIMNSKLIDRDQLYAKFYTFINDEGNRMVPASTIEATVALKDTSRPSTVSGLILHSFAMYKNFPVTLQMLYGRLMLDSASQGGRGRAAFAAGMLASMTMAGALGIQLRELSRGRTPQDMTTPNFWGRALATGGGLGIWGEMLFSGVNQYGRGIPEQIGGPLAGFVQDTANLTIGKPYRWVTTGEWGETPFAADAVNYAKRYTPYSNLWYTRLALERNVWDNLEEMADPKAAQKRRRRMKTQKETFGNEYFWEPGQSNPFTR